MPILLEFLYSLVRMDVSVENEFETKRRKVYHIQYEKCELPGTVTSVNTPHVVEDKSISLGVDRNFKASYFREYSHYEVRNNLEASYLHEQIKAVLVCLRMVGALPFGLTSKGVSFRVCSLPMMYSVMVYLLSLPMIVVIYKYIAKRISLHAGVFHEFIFAQLFMSMLVTYLLVPVTSWWDSPKMAQYFNKWIEFQNFYQVVTGKCLQLNIKKTATAFLISNFCTPVIPLTLWVIFPPNISIYHTPTFYFNSMLYSFPVQLLWKFVCNAMAIAGDNIAKCFQEELKFGISSTSVSQYKLLWLKLNRLSGQWGYASYHMYCVYLLAYFWFFTSSAYGCLASIKHEDYIKLGLFTAASFFSCVPLLVICDVAHSVPIRVSSIQDSLSEIPQSSLSPAVRAEVQSFIQVTSTKMPVSLGGFIDVNRQLLQAAGVLAVTYLIVLLQFQFN